MTRFEQYVERKQREYGTKFDMRALAPNFRHYFDTGERIKVQCIDGIVTGTVGITTGWKPCFLLIRSRRSRGSSILLSNHAQIVAVKHGRTYQPVNTYGPRGTR